MADAGATLDLHWIPLGAGARVVRASGRLYEAGTALIERRPPRPIFHSALVADTAEGRYSIEMTPVPARGDAARRGVVGGGPVGCRLLGRFRVFRYEIRRWLDGVIPDIGDAVGGPVRVSDDPDEVRCVLALLPCVPAEVWGRDAAHAGEMWNSNSVISWTLERAGLAERVGPPPCDGRAPGWHAGIVVARRATAAPDRPAAAGGTT